MVTWQWLVRAFSESERETCLEGCSPCSAEASQMQERSNQSLCPKGCQATESPGVGVGVRAGAGDVCAPGPGIPASTVCPAQK